MINTLVFDQEVGSETLKIEITSPAGGGLPTVYSLHGAGPSNRVRAEYIARAFAEKGQGVLRFDFSGWGDSTGERVKASLARRLNEARAVSRHLDPHAPLTLIGTSMGAHIAARLLQYLNVVHLVLFCPAAYSINAENQPFDDSFTAILRQPNSWIDSPVWNELRSFRGRLTIIIGAKDTIIPEEVLNLYLEAGNNADLHFFRIESAPHNLHDWLGENLVIQKQILEAVMMGK